ncbi:hypothetical protein [Oleiharenicola lentus]|uniref:hypothetical protein n=1 Tax=Oleiharenicola lentus TaxID=2508720 RepID=UPI003F668FA0
MSRRSVAFAGLTLVLGAVLALWLWLPSHQEKTPPVSATPAADSTAAAGVLNARPPTVSVPPALASELAQLLAITDPDERFRKLDDFWRQWFARDREGMFAAIAGLPPGDERSQALLYSLLELARIDPDRAFELALALVRDERDGPLFSSLFDFFAKQDLARARERLARVPAGPGFEPAWRAYTDAYARADLDAALSWAQGVNGAARALALETTLYTLAEKDPLAAFETALQGLDGEARDRSLYHALMQIIPFDPAGAAKLILTMPASASREMAATAAARAWAEDAPDLALAWAATLPKDATTSAALATANVLEIWGQRDSTAAKAALVALPEGEARAAAAERLASAIVTKTPEQAFDWALSLPDGMTQDRALAAAVSAWARQDPATAAAWTMASGAGDERGALLADIVSHWAVQDLAAAQGYVGSLGEAAAQSKATAALIPYLVQNDPPAAIAWAQALAQTSVRTEAMRAVYRAWLVNDPAAARAWAKSAAAPPDW